MNACVFVTVNAERVIGESEKMMDLLLQWGQQRPEVRFFLHRGRAHNLPTGKHRSSYHSRDGSIPKLWLRCDTRM